MTSRLWVCCSNQLSYKSDIHLVKITILMIADAKVRLFLEPCKFFIIFFVFLLSYGLILLGLTDGAGGVNGWNVFLGHGCWQRERRGESCSRREPWRGILWGMVICVCVITMRAPLASPSRLTGMVIRVCVMVMGWLDGDWRSTADIGWRLVVADDYIDWGFLASGRLRITIVEKMGECRFWI